MNRVNARLAFSKFLELPQNELKEAIRLRLNGEAAGLFPILEEKCEHPADLLISIYDFEGDDEFRRRFDAALVSLLEEIQGNLDKTETKYFRRLISLVGRNEVSTANVCVTALLRESESQKTRNALNHNAILSVLPYLQ